jgi:peptidyl-prolyl cis-trans isomerase C
MKIQNITKSILLSMVVLAMVPGFQKLAWSNEVATVNGKTITDKDMVQALGSVNETQRKDVLDDANSRRQLLNSLIEQELLIQESEKEKLDQDADYKTAVDAFRRQYLTNRVLSKNLSGKFTESAAKRYYENHKNRYSTEQVHAMHILVSDESKAMEVMKMAQAPNADFQALAEKYSKDPSAKNNRGDIGFFGRDRMVAEFTNAAFGAKDGEIVGPVKTAYGYHIIKVLEKKAGKVLEYSDVESKVKSDLQQELASSYMTNLRSQAKISIDDKALNKM